jgi:hypothetical protein
MCTVPVNSRENRLFLAGELVALDSYSFRGWLPDPGKIWPRCGFGVVGEEKRGAIAIFIVNEKIRQAIALLNLKIYIFCLAASGTTAQVAVLADDT